MKRCPACQTVYEDRIDFCFEDGSPLEEHDSSSDPTALPSGLDAPERPAAAESVVVEKKPRGRGMFARPSVADMLSLPEPGVVPPAGGHRVAAPAAPAASTAETSPAPVVLTPSIASAVGSGDQSSDYTDPEADTLIYDRDTLNTEIDEPDDVPFASVPPSIEVPSAAIDVPASVEAVEVPGTDDSFEDSFDAPPGLEEPTAVSLDDSWFGGEEDGDGEFPGMDDAVDAVDSIEDPGFADVAQSGDIGFDDSSWAANDAPKGESSDGGPNKVILGVGAVLLLAAAVFAGVMIMPGDDAAPVVEAPVVKAAPVAKVLPPPPPEEPMEDLEADDGTADAMDVEGAADDEALDDGEEAKPEAPDVEEERTVPVVVPTVVERIEQDKPDRKPAVPVSAPKAAKAAKASSPKVAKAAKAATVAPQTPWTGASTTAAAPTKPTTANANPWGAPVETASRGRMTITTEPLGAMVYVDGRRIGKSPTRTEVTYGTHKVRVDLKDYKASSRVVNVQVAEVAVPFRLETATMMGRCNLLGPMGSSVSMDGKSVGRVPTTVSCSPGSHRFTVTPKDGAPFTVSKKVVIAGPGESVAVQLFPG
jgi:hypothetical protein